MDVIGGRGGCEPFLRVLLAVLPHFRAFPGMRHVCAREPPTILVSYTARLYINHTFRSCPVVISQGYLTHNKPSVIIQGYLTHEKTPPPRTLP